MKTNRIMALALSLVLMGTAAFAATSKKANTVTITVIGLTGVAGGGQDQNLNGGLENFIKGQNNPNNVEVKFVDVDREAALKDPKYEGLNLDYMPLYLVEKNKITEEKFAEAIKYGQLKANNDFIIFEKQTGNGVYVNRKPIPNQLEIFVMSQCPYGVQAEERIINAMKLDKLPKNVNINIRYIASEDGNSFNSLHGSAEWEEDVRQLIIKKYYPQKFWNYLEIRNKDYKSSLWDEAAEKAGINPKVFKKYWKEGLEMLREEVKHGNEYNVNSSPTVIWEGRVVTNMGSLGSLPGFEEMAKTFGGGSGAAAQQPSGSC